MEKILCCKRTKHICSSVGLNGRIGWTVLFILLFQKTGRANNIFIKLRPCNILKKKYRYSFLKARSYEQTRKFDIIFTLQLHV